MDVREVGFWEDEAQRSRLGKELARLIDYRLAAHATGESFKDVTDSIERKMRVLNGEDVAAEEKQAANSAWDDMKRKGRG